jgi:hypothetical protein
MTIQEFRDYMASGKTVVGGGEVHMMFIILMLPSPKRSKEFWAGPSVPFHSMVYA